MHALFMLHPWLAIAALTALVVFGQVQIPDAGGGPAAEPAGSGGDPSPDPVGDAAGGGDPADRAAAAGGGDDDLDDDERELPEDVRNDPKRLRTRYRRLQRQFGPAARIAERFRGTDGRYLAPDQIDRMRSRAQDMDEIQALLDEHPDITQLMLERRRKGAAPAADAADEWTDPYAAQLDKLPFDPANDSSQWFLNEFRRLDKTNHELRQALKRVEQGVGGVTEREQQRSAQQVENTWKDQTLAAARSANLKGEDLEDYVNTVYANFRAAKAEGRLEKIDRKQIIERALRVFRRTRTAGDRQAAVAAHTRADGNRTLPAPHSRAAAGPANPKETNRVGTIRDGRKSFFDRIGMSAPPGVR